MPFEEGRLIASLIPGARFVPLESSNHLLLENEPAWQRWLEEVRAFLPAGPGRFGFAALTARERELLELIAQGRDNAQIAAQLELSEKTVRNHITSIFAKLDVENRAQAIVLARDAGFGKSFVTPPPRSPGTTVPDIPARRPHLVAAWGSGLIAPRLVAANAFTEAKCPTHARRRYRRG